ncbi:MAG: exodeoxyribonuclease VII large subunit, partial [Candidatus Neomarinimicrobiota bacterium]
MIDSKHTITISELTAQIKNILESKFDSIWVSGEISNFKHHYSGHMYFTLKDDSTEIKAVMFKGFNQYLRIKPEDGMQVLANGRLSVYEQRGQYQLILTKLEPSGIGTLYLAFEALKKQLAKESLFDIDRKKELPKYPDTIGVITSQSGAAVQDIFRVMERRAPFVDVILRATKVQGEGAALDIVRAIEEFNEYKKINVIIMGRGGGSLEDLWPFNEEVVARAISASRIPIISAVGHETDYSISDMVADKYASTPSAAAEIV